jgi:penicillin V acylase-like amidase (Ntn superfamily)
MKAPTRTAVCAILIFLVGSLPVFDHPASACTSVCLSKDGQVVFGNNLDWFINEGVVVINKRKVKKRGAWGANPPEWISKYASVTTNQSGNGFPCRGMNEAGLVIGEMWLGQTGYPDRDSRPSVNTDQWQQYQLDNCATIEEVLATDKVLRIDKDEYKSHFFICDASGKCATIEWIDGKLRALAGDEVKIKAMVNSPYAECLARGDDRSGRFAKAAGMLENYAGEDPVEYVFSILRATRQKSTLWSLVFDVKNHRLYYFTALNPEIRSVCLDEFDPSCDSPVQILDINAPGKGDVKASFKDFTHEENVRVVRPALEKWKARNPSFSETDIEKTLNYHKTMQCMPTVQK